MKASSKSAAHAPPPNSEAAGAHYVIDSVADLPQVLEDIERRLQRGERPVVA